MSIEEMSKQFANKLYGENMVNDEWLKARYFYERGANAVLEEIEEAYYKEIDLLKTCDAIKIKIEELKEGE